MRKCEHAKQMCWRAQSTPRRRDGRTNRATIVPTPSLMDVAGCSPQYVHQIITHMTSSQKSQANFAEILNYFTIFICT